MRKKVYSWKFYDCNLENKFQQFLEELEGDSANEKLNFFWKKFFEIKDHKPEKYEPQQLQGTFLDDDYFCRDAGLTFKVRYLPCVEKHKKELPPLAPDKCKICWKSLRPRIPESWFEKNGSEPKNQSR